MIDFSLDLYSITLLLLAGVGAGFIDSTVGGGGLVALPVMMALNIPPHNIIATNKVHAAVGTSFSLYRFHKKGMLDISKFFPGAFILTLVFSFLGAVVIRFTADTIIYKMIPIIMVAILIYKILFFNHGVEETNKHLIKPALFIAIFSPLIGFYDGFFGPGTGMLWIFALVTFLGQNMLQASGTTKLLNVASNIGAIILFIPTGLILYKVGFIMALGQIAGSWFGVHLSVKKGTKFINMIFISVMSVLVIRLFWKYYF